MPLFERIKLTDFRNYPSREFVFDHDKILLTGNNGVGKTNVLESIYFLSILRSFRTNSVKELVRLGQRSFHLDATLNLGKYRENIQVTQFAAGKRELSIDGKAISRASEFIYEFRAVVFVPEDREICGGSSQYRRRFFDMLISMLDLNYLASLMNYNRGLLQRNKLIKAKADVKLIAAFEKELAANAVFIRAMRQKYVSLVELEVNQLLATAKDGDFIIRYQPEYPAEVKEYCRHFDKIRDKELYRGFTLTGPHLDDFELSYHGKNVRLYGSTGQVRILSLLLKLAEFLLVKANDLQKTVVLVDDVTGDLDERNTGLFYSVINRADQQFFTFTADNRQIIDGKTIDICFGQ